MQLNFPLLQSLDYLLIFFTECPYKQCTLRAETDVCGTNYVTYKSDCALECAAESDSSIKLAYDGKCGNSRHQEINFTNLLCAFLCQLNFTAFWHRHR